MIHRQTRKQREWFSEVESKRLGRKKQQTGDKKLQNKKGKELEISTY